jgi:hypothetical protein
MKNHHICHGNTTFQIIELNTLEMRKQKLEYIHYNPVEVGFCSLIVKQFLLVLYPEGNRRLNSYQLYSILIINYLENPTVQKLLTGQ